MGGEDVNNIAELRTTFWLVFLFCWRGRRESGVLEEHINTYADLGQYATVSARPISPSQLLRPAPGARSSLAWHLKANHLSL